MGGAGKIEVHQETPKDGQPWWLSGLVLLSAQGLILEIQDQVLCQAPCMEPPSASASLSLCVSY